MSPQCEEWIMRKDVTKEVQDLTYLKWSHIRGSSGTAGTFLKARSVIGEKKKYYKLSNFDPEYGVIGHECINEIIVDRLLTILGVEHLEYELIHADIRVDGRRFRTWLCSSEDFKSQGESKAALDDYYRVNANPGEDHYEFCVRNGWKRTVDQMIAVDYLILNRDRHGGNIEILSNSRLHELRMAPMFDHGLSLLCSCMSEDEAERFDVMEDRRCNNYIGSKSCFENLQRISDAGDVFSSGLKDADRELLFYGLDGTLSDIYFQKIWEMLSKRYKVYEDLRDHK